VALATKQLCYQTKGRQGHFFFLNKTFMEDGKIKCKVQSSKSKAQNSFPRGTLGLNLDFGF
jgi:hypothetical protein